MNAIIEHNEKVSREVADQDFERFAEAMDLDLDPSGMDEEDRKSLEKAKARLVNAIVQGQLAIDPKGQPVFTPAGDEKPITFREPTGASLMAMDQKKKNHDVAKMFATMADMTQESIQRFAKMPNRDLKTCMAIATLFLG